MSIEMTHAKHEIRELSQLGQPMNSQSKEDRREESEETKIARPHHTDHNSFYWSSESGYKNCKRHSCIFFRHSLPRSHSVCGKRFFFAYRS